MSVQLKQRSGFTNDNGEAMRASGVGEDVDKELLFNLLPCTGIVEVIDAFQEIFGGNESSALSGLTANPVTDAKNIEQDYYHQMKLQSGC